MFPESTSLPAVSRIASAAGAMAITSVLLLAVGLGFSAPASAEGVSRAGAVARSAAAGAAMTRVATAAQSGTGAAAQSGTGAAAQSGTGAAAQSGTATAAQSDAASVARGRYLVATAGCNDCHTAGYAEAGGKVAQSEWLLGTPVGFRGPWGVSYPANLRLTVQSVTEEEWLKFSRVERLPPMPWFNLRDMNDADLRSMYRFIKSLGPKGGRAPAPLSPNANVGTPYIQFTPQNLPAVTQVAPAVKQGGRG